ncbi:hypothetical protein PSPO01_16675 [Paraphaeosphaeria sporulosa]
MAYNGGIRFLDEEEMSFGFQNWITSLRFDTHREHALIADVGRFRGCTTKWAGSRYDISDISKRTEDGIRYDVEHAKSLVEENCVIVGITGNVKHYYILVVRPTSMDGEYERVGMGQVQKNCVVRVGVDVRVV